MEKDRLEKLIDCGLTITEMKDVLQCGRSTVSYWLKKYSLTTNNSQQPRDKKHYCNKCGETDELKFYGNDKQVCAECHSKRVHDKGRENRKYAVEKLGGKCSICGYDKYIGALDMHHIDPKIKDKNFKSMKGWSMTRLDEEIKKCILLCKNCHAEIHSNERGIS